MIGFEEFSETFAKVSPAHGEPVGRLAEGKLNIKQEVNNIAVFNDVFFTF